MKWLRIKAPNTMLIIFAISIGVAILTWIVPGGEYERREYNGRQVVAAETFRAADNQPQHIQVLMAPIRGFLAAAEIIAFVLIVGGAFSVLQATQAVDAVIKSVAKAQERMDWVRMLAIPIFMTLFSLGGAIFGMSEETIPFVLVFVPLALSLGYDSITGIAIPYVGAHVGFAAAFLNPFTLGIAQGIAELPFSSGLPYRVICWFVFTTIAILFVMRYAARVRRDPTISPTFAHDEERRKHIDLEAIRNFGGLTRTHVLVLAVFAISMIVMIFGVMQFGWYIQEIAGLFLAMGILAGLAARLSGDAITSAFISGAKLLVGTALIIALARGILIIAEDGRIIDTILHALVSAIEGTPGVVSAGVMFLVQSSLNFFVPSGSGQAALTMPIMAPLADLLGITRQTAVLAYQFGDGFSNMFFPTAPVLLGALSLADVPWEKWAGWMWKLQLLFVIAGLLMLIPPVLMNWQ